MTMHPQQELAWIWLTLWNDMRVCEPHLGNKADRTGNPWRRHYVRAFFAMVEAISHNMRELLLERQQEGIAELTDGELWILRGKQVDLDDSGKVKERDVFFKTMPTIKFTLKCFAKYADKTDELAAAFQDNAWTAFREVQRVRNSITHPKNTTALVLNDQFMLTVKSAGEWFMNTASDLIEFDFTQPE